MKSKTARTALTATDRSLRSAGTAARRAIDHLFQADLHALTAESPEVRAAVRACFKGTNTLYENLTSARAAVRRAKRKS